MQLLVATWTRGDLTSFSFIFKFFLLVMVFNRNNGGSRQILAHLGKFGCRFALQVFAVGDRGIHPTVWLVSSWSYELSEVGLLSLRLTLGRGLETRWIILSKRGP